MTNVIISGDKPGLSGINLLASVPSIPWQETKIYLVFWEEGVMECRCKE